MGSANDFMDFLKPGGRIVIISYHSMEDRMVKHKFKELKLNKELKVLSKKPFIPTVDDLHHSGRNFPPNFLHESWMDYLYWDVELLP